MTPGTSGAALLEARGVRKSYGPVHALRGVDFRIRKGETIALVGDNGAGKSTFVKILSGAIQPTGGEILFDGRPIAISSTEVARNLGIETVYQDLGLCDNLSVADNIFLGRERTWGIAPLRFLDKRSMRAAADNALKGLSVNVPRADANVSGLSGGQRQAVALARTKLWKSSLVLLDEPTAALGVQETKRAMDAVRKLQEQGISIVLISHNMPLVMEMSHRVVVLRHGTKVGDVPTASVNGDDIVSLITGARQTWIEAA
ncbi:ATP-binding cassette domain-containing protein [Bradyrhizobium neotropicale]|uniref:ATP-binding cassette domain-containing protein n=1 Tax=Bradyrhizobium neotropicale TaxID=1497615 RepID=UPI001AD6B375|nr:ATP-binding cassette domain-containing protein [Bradyrhizobium neotropicale]MBO4223943.1 ATP-binding cassette domain-containing protein [Bradyrhizobium neotropicale]